MYNTSGQIKFKTTKLKSSLCDYNDVCILAVGAITILKQKEQELQQTDKQQEKTMADKGVIFNDTLRAYFCYRHRLL